MTNRLTVIIPCRNERAHIRNFLEGLLKQQFPPGTECEVLISDGMSDDGTAVRGSFAEASGLEAEVDLERAAHFHRSTSLVLPPVTATKSLLITSSTRRDSRWARRRSTSSWFPRRATPSFRGTAVRTR